ncbi:MAG: hypothetical protein CVV27_09085 [Candidatus Melainabacteria bacterium HGW-Melainabacteria-1]|nr:MAG: hypothetical protein CVV27_09085 [Candidatus Melainabacteria bacterium HGW-Melainabacteria-1]
MAELVHKQSYKLVRQMLLLYRVELGNPLSQLGLELVLALSGRFQLHGKIDVLAGEDEAYYDYRNADEAMGLLCSFGTIGMLTIKTNQFSLLFAHAPNGIELDFVPYHPDGESLNGEIADLARTILKHLEQMAFAVEHPEWPTRPRSNPI